HWFWESQEISKVCNTSLIAIIPKVTGLIGLDDFRPTSLIECYYKIIAKLPAERLKVVVGKLVGDVHNAFINGRYILDGVLIANETVNFLKQKKNKCLMFKVDFEKAYDSLNWEYLMDVMKSIGFVNKWRRGIEVCMKSASIFVLVNGSPTKEFYMGRGVRQGDPLSPFLFLLAPEGLNVLVNDAVDRGIFNGFEKVSGLNVNLNKSRVYGVGVSRGEVEDMARCMRCSVGELPITYLGLPVGVCMRSESSWRSVVKKFKKHLTDWKDKAMSFGG
ncbi:cysteine-rich receptor-like protein kinase, partial [Tanacetum coccineum]